MSNNKNAVLGVGVLGAMVLGGGGAGLYLITNRTNADVARAKELRTKGWANMTGEERAEFSGHMKGAYNHSDMNRVESAVRQISSEMNAVPAELKKHAEEKKAAWNDLFDVPYSYPVELRTREWYPNEIPTDEDLARYIGNVRSLRFSMDYPSPPLPTTMDRLTHTGANAIEQALEGLSNAIQPMLSDRKTRIDNTAAAFIYSGETYGGEV